MMAMHKSKEIRLKELKEHAILLKESCERFREKHALYEVKNIAVRLRVLVGDGKGNGLLRELAKKKISKVLVLKLEHKLCLQEVEDATGCVIQEVTMRALAEVIPSYKNTLPIISLNKAFAGWLVEEDFFKWIGNGFLMGWEIPRDDGGTPEIKIVRPVELISAFAANEGAHADFWFHKDFGAPFDIKARKCIFNGKEIEMPLTYNYLYQIGVVVSALTLDFLRDQGVT